MAKSYDVIYASADLKCGLILPKNAELDSFHAAISTEKQILNNSQNLLDEIIEETNLSP